MLDKVISQVDSHELGIEEPGQQCPHHPLVLQLLLWPGVGSAEVEVSQGCIDNVGKQTQIDEELECVLKSR